MKVIQTVPSVDIESSGPSYSVVGLCRGLASNEVDVELHVPGAAPIGNPNFIVREYHRSTLFHMRGAEWSGELLSGLKESCRSAAIIHSHSLWMIPNIYPYWAKKGTECKLITQPRGTLSEWALSLSKWKKRLSGWCGQYAAMRATDMWVATAEDEYNDIRRLGYTQPVAILPNGVDLPYLGDNDTKQSSGGRRRMFFLSRIHPKKNVEMLIRCWARLESQFPEWDLSIVGPDKNNPYADHMKDLAMQLSCQRVTFEGELNGDAKYHFMAKSDCEVLPTHSENFGMVVAEALACGTPVICSHGAPWKGLVTNKCGWWVPTEELALESAMHEAMSLDDTARREMGARGREWMKRDFDWNAIGRKMKASYEWLLNGGDKPEWVC